MRDIPLFEGPLTIRVAAYLPIPVSWSKKKRDSALFPVSKPDGDNFLKAAVDALNGIVFKDDSQAADLHVSKRYSVIPHLAIVVEEMKAEAA